MDPIVVWAIARRAGAAVFEMRPHVEVPGGWRELDATILATSMESAQALLPAGSLLLFVSDDAEWWAPWHAPDWWWPEGEKPSSMWTAPPVRAPAWA